MWQTSCYQAHVKLECAALAQQQTAVALHLLLQMHQCPLAADYASAFGLGSRMFAIAPVTWRPRTMYLATGRKPALLAHQCLQSNERTYVDVPIVHTAEQQTDAGFSWSGIAVGGCSLLAS